LIEIPSVTSGPLAEEEPGTPCPDRGRGEAASSPAHEAIGRDLPDLVSFMLGTGCRIGEAAGLLWEDVDLEHEL
jgi:integrase